MAAPGYPIIVREAWIYIVAATVVAAAATHWLGWLPALPFWLLLVALAFIFRDPERDIPSVPLAVVSPADGVVEAIEAQANPYLNRDSIRIAIRMSPFGAYATRSPVEGKVQERWHLSESGDDQDSTDGLRFGFWIRTDEGEDLVLVMHRAGALNTPRCYVQSGERVGQGQRCGFVRFGSIVELYLPANARVDVGNGQHVHAGSDIVATLMRK